MGTNLTCVQWCHMERRTVWYQVLPVCICTRCQLSVHDRLCSGPGDVIGFHIKLPALLDDRNPDLELAPTRGNHFEFVFRLRY